MDSKLYGPRSITPEQAAEFKSAIGMGVIRVIFLSTWACMAVFFGVLVVANPVTFQALAISAATVVFLITCFSLVMMDKLLSKIWSILLLVFSLLFLALTSASIPIQKMELYHQAYAREILDFATGFTFAFILVFLTMVFIVPIVLKLIRVINSKREE